MNWNAITFDWNQVRAFLAASETGSFSEAAKVLKTSQPTLSRQVSALEENLGVTLFERSKRAMRLTRAGSELLEHVRVMGDAAMKVSLAVAAQNNLVSGKISISAPDLVSTFILPKILGTLQDQTPDLKIDLISSNSYSDLSVRESDIAIQHKKPDQPDVIAKFVGNSTAHIYASKKYISKNGYPSSLSDLSESTFIGLNQHIDYLSMLQSNGLNLTESNFKFMSSSGSAIVEMVKEGQGLTILPDFIAARIDELKIVSTIISIPVPVWIVAHIELRKSKKIRLVLDFLINNLIQKRSITTEKKISFLSQKII